jgi:site-specific recombinase XerD
MFVCFRWLIAKKSLRAFFASLAEDAGIDPFTIQEMMNHKDIKTTKIYLGRPGKRIQNAIKNLNDRAKFLTAI